MNDVLAGLWAYWQQKRRDRTMPARKDIDPIDIPSVLKHLLLFDVLDGRLRCRLCGTAVAELYGRDPTGKYLDEMVPGHRFAIAQKVYVDVIAAARPLIVRYGYADDVTTDFVATRLLLPLSEDGRRVNMIIEGLTTEQTLQHKRPSLGASTAFDPNLCEQEFL